MTKFKNDNALQNIDENNRKLSCLPMCISALLLAVLLLFTGRLYEQFQS